MPRLIAAYAVTLIVMVAVDLLWLGVVAKPVYQQGIGHLMAERPNIAAAVVFYALFALGLMIFAIVPHASTDAWGTTLLAGAMFGFFAYATYDLTNLATLKNWPIRLSILDIAWGSFLSVLSAAAGKWVLTRFAAT